MTRTSISALAIVIALSSAGIMGCARTAPGPDAQPAGVVAPPADSPLAKVEVGMTPRQVEDTIGRPTDENQYVTGKMFIPWYFGRDRMRRAYFYEGVGRVIFQGGGGFSGNFTVRHVEYDPSEDGRAK